MSGEACEFRGPIGECDVIDFVADADYVKGDVIAVEDALGVLVEDTDDTEDGVLVVHGPIKGPMAAVTIVAGEDAYFDSGNSVFTNVVGSNRKCGHFDEARANTASTADLMFDGYGS